MLSRELIGRTSQPVTLDIERGHIRRFCEAIGEDDPIYFDEQAARAAGHPQVPAPPTFAAALRPNDARAGIDLDWKKILHGEQEFTFARPLYAGDRLTLVQRIADLYEKSGKGGAMDLLVLETEARDAQNQVVFTARATIVVKR